VYGYGLHYRAMKTRLPAALLLAASVVACGRTDSPAPAASSASFDMWADRFAEEWVRHSPQMATRSQYFTAAEQDALDRQLTMIGEWDWAFGARALAGRADRARLGLEQLARFDVASFTPQQRTYFAGAWRTSSHSPGFPTTDPCSTSSTAFSSI
jgi:hypothetical protein